MTINPTVTGGKQKQTLRRSTDIAALNSVDQIETGDTNVSYEVIYNNQNKAQYILHIVAFDGTLPAAHTTFANNAAVPIGSYWYTGGSNATNIHYKKTAASTWTSIAPTA